MTNSIVEMSEGQSAVEMSEDHSASARVVGQCGFCAYDTDCVY